MSLLSRLESRFGRFAIPNLTGMLIIGQVVLFTAQTLRAAQGQGGNPFANLYLIPAKVMQGEVWRVISFAFVPFSDQLLYLIITWLLFYFFGTTLENYWGTFRYNVFMGIGLVANVAASFVTLSMGPEFVAQNYFLYGTVFLAFARLFPDFTINLFFVLPIRIKWLALLAWIGYGFGIAQGNWMDRLLIVASVANYIVFFGREHWHDVKSGHRRRSFQTRAKATAKGLVHECRVCGLNSEGAPKTMFRYCSKCAGQCCYCPDHIHDHEHVIDDDETADDSHLANSGQA